MANTCLWPFFIVILLLIAFWVYWKNAKIRENYGGPIKKIRRIPKNTCYDICGQYYRDCMSRSWSTDAGLCDNRYRNCVAQCNYTDFHRL